MILEDNPYLDQLSRDCQEFADNISGWQDTEDIKMIEDKIGDIEEDITFVRSFGE